MSKSTILQPTSVSRATDASQPAAAEEQPSAASLPVPIPKFFARIEPQLTVASASATEDINYAREGITATINCSETDKLPGVVISCALPLEELMDSELQQIYERIRDIIADIGLGISNGHKLLVCCNTGLDESALILACREIGAGLSSAAATAKIERVFTRGLEGAELERVKRELLHKAYHKKIVLTYDNWLKGVL